MPEHAHEGASLTLVLAGRFEEQIDGSSHRLSSFSVIYKPPGVPHTTSVGERAAWSLNVSIPRDAVRGIDDSRTLILDGGPLATAMLAVLRALTGAMPTHLGFCIDECLLHLAQATQRVAPGHDPLIERASALITRGASIGAAARRVGVDPATLWRRFRRSADVTPSAWRRRARVRAAATRLADTPAPIAAIAAAAGFADQAHLTRAFRRETGVTPLAYRALAAGPDAPPSRNLDRIASPSAGPTRLQDPFKRPRRPFR